MRSSAVSGGPIQIAVTALLVAAVLFTVQQLRAADPPKGPLPVGNPTAGEFPGLHNVFRFSEKLYSGGVPEGDPGFRSLRQLGIKTIITVDGARPDLARARKYGMRYVHLPIQYDGCPAPTANRIVRAVRDLPGPIYLHCHHGKHRSPTASMFARIALDGISNEAAVKEMERAGTGKNYIGLYGDVRAYKPPTAAELDRVQPHFPEVSPTPPLTEAMVQIDHRFEGLTHCQKAGWKTPQEHPDLLPAHEALQLRELYTELNRMPEIKKRPADYQQWMREGQEKAQALETALRAGEPERATVLLGQIAAGCGTCHAKYRNVPQPR
jgi:protein tyrosine phosphatase (PTP) superfamily phosphohydrolase (DUF442 family)